MSYLKQDEIEPIIAKEYLLAHWQEYGLVNSKTDFVALLNILQACGESLDSLHNAYFNGENEFCDIFHDSSWNSDRKIVDTLLEFCTFYTEQEFIDMILDKREDYDDEWEYVEAMRQEATDDIGGNNDVQITKTEDGYVRRIWY